MRGRGRNQPHPQDGRPRPPDGMRVLLRFGQVHWNVLLHLHLVEHLPTLCPPRGPRSRPEIGEALLGEATPTLAVLLDVEVQIRVDCVQGREGGREGEREREREREILKGEKRRKGETTLVRWRQNELEGEGGGLTSVQGDGGVILWWLKLVLGENRNI